MARTSVIGMIARVLVIFTIAAESRVLLPWIPSQAAAAAAAVALISEEQLVLQLPALEPFDQLAPFETEQLLGALPEPFFYGDAAPAPDDPKYRLDDFIRDDRPMDERPHDDELLAAAISTDNPSFF